MTTEYLPVQERIDILTKRLISLSIGKGDYDNGGNRQFAIKETARLLAECMKEAGMDE